MNLFLLLYPACPPTPQDVLIFFAVCCYMFRGSLPFSVLQPGTPLHTTSAELFLRQDNPGKLTTFNSFLTFTTRQTSKNTNNFNQMWTPNLFFYFWDNLTTHLCPATISYSSASWVIGLQIYARHQHNTSGVNTITSWSCNLGVVASVKHRLDKI